MQSHGKDLKGQTLSRAAAAGRLVAGGTGDNTEITGATLNLASLAGRPASVVFEIIGRGVLAAAATLVIAAELESSADGSTWEDLVASATVLTLTGGGGGSTELGVGRIGVDLIKEDVNYIRVKMTPNLSAANTDTAEVAAVAVFGGLSRT